jgi:hypothetical protein
MPDALNKEMVTYEKRYPADYGGFVGLGGCLCGQSHDEEVEWHA